MHSTGWRYLAIHSHLGDDATNFAWQERFLNYGTAALGDKFAQCRGQRVAGHKDDAPGLPRPASFDLLVEGAPVQIGHADIGKDHIVVFRRHPLQRFAPGTRGYHSMPRAVQYLRQCFANFRFVINDEYRMLARALPRSRPGIGNRRPNRADGQRNGKHRASLAWTIDRERTAMGL